MKNLRGVAALAMTIALALAGCGGDSEESSPSSQKEPKKSEKKAQSSPTPTEDAKKQEAVAAIKSWIDTSNEVRRTLDPAAVDKLESLSTEKCMACEARVSTAREFAQGGGRYKGDFEEEYQDFDVTDDAEGENELEVMVNLRNGDWQSVGKGGKVQDMAKAAEHETRFFVRWKDDQWLVGEVLRNED